MSSFCLTQNVQALLLFSQRYRNHFSRYPPKHHHHHHLFVPILSPRPTHRWPSRPRQNLLQEDHHLSLAKLVRISQHRYFLLCYFLHEYLRILYFGFHFAIPEIHSRYRSDGFPGPSVSGIEFLANSLFSAVLFSALASSHALLRFSLGEYALSLSSDGLCNTLGNIIGKIRIESKRAFSLYNSHIQPVNISSRQKKRYDMIMDSFEIKFRL